MLYPASQGSIVTVTPQFTTQTGNDTGQVIADWYQPSDPVAGTYPAPLTADVVLTVGSVRLIASGTAAVPANPTFYNIPLELAATDMSLRIVVTNPTHSDEPALGYIVNGGTTEVDWSNIAGLGLTEIFMGVPVGVPIYGSADPTATLTLQSPGPAGTYDYWVFALPIDIFEGSLANPTITVPGQEWASVPFDVVFDSSGPATLVPDNVYAELDPSVSITGDTGTGNLALLDGGATFFQRNTVGEATFAVPREKTFGGITATWSAASNIRITGSYLQKLSLLV
jgi:hypothetical protein